MDLDAAADELYGANPDEFVERRTALVAAARKAGDRPLAKEIGQLRKPTRTAWLVNLVARAEPAKLKDLLDLAAAFQDAQNRRAGDDLRTLSRQRRQSIDALTKRAVALAAEAGYSPPDSAVQEVSGTLQAALGDPPTAEVVRAGRLVQATTYGGFGPVGSGGGGEGGQVIDLMAALQASTTNAKRSGGGAKTEAKSDGEDADQPDEAETKQSAAERKAAEQRRAEAAQVLADATKDWDASRDAAEQAAEEADAATEEADGLAERIEALRTELREAESAERSARETARSARKRAMQLRQEAAAAERSMTAARAMLAALDT